MDAMYLNLMFINPRPPVGAGAKGARCTRPSLTPPPPAKNPGSAPAGGCHGDCQVGSSQLRLDGDITTVVVLVNLSRIGGSGGY